MLIAECPSLALGDLVIYGGSKLMEFLNKPVEIWQGTTAHADHVTTSHGRPIAKTKF
jgi:hypothetical protein